MWWSILEYAHVSKLLCVIQNGCTEPIDAMLDSGERVIVKPFNNIQGNLVLVNEYICYKICTELEIPAPEAGIALIDEKTECLCDEVIITSNNYGCCFYSKRIDKATIINPAIIPRILNKEDFYKILLFDHFVYNKDRNRGNLIVTMGKNIRMYAIDHTHVFKNECIWDKNCLNMGIELSDYNDDNIIVSNKEIYNFFWEHLNKDEEILLNIANAFKDKIDYNKLEEFISELPLQWRIPDEDINALKNYLMYRLEHLDNICNMIVGGE